MFILREICVEKGITSNKLAELTGISKRTIDEFRGRRREPYLSVGLKIADALGIDPHELFLDDGEQLGIIKTNEISEIMDKYDIDVETLALISDCDTDTLSGYIAGQQPTKAHSDNFYRLLNEESYLKDMVDAHDQGISVAQRKRIDDRFIYFSDIAQSKELQIANYILSQLGAVNEDTLQMLLYYSCGVNYALNDKKLLENMSFNNNGPYYPDIRAKYGSFGYKPIDNSIPSTHGCMMSLVSRDEIKAIDLVIKSFGLYSANVLKTLILKKQLPWISNWSVTAASGTSNIEVDEEAVKRYFMEKQLFNANNIVSYILNVYDA